MTLEDGQRIITAAFALLVAGRLTAKEYSEIYFSVTEATTAHPVRRAGV